MRGCLEGSVCLCWVVSVHMLRRSSTAAAWSDVCVESDESFGQLGRSSVGYLKE